MKNLTHAQNRHYPIMEQNCLTQSSLYDRILNISCYLKLGVLHQKLPMYKMQMTYGLSVEHLHPFPGGPCPACIVIAFLSHCKDQTTKCKCELL